MYALRCEILLLTVGSTGQEHLQVVGLGKVIIELDATMKFIHLNMFR
jgi:hypothetical protein